MKAPRLFEHINKCVDDFFHTELYENGSQSTAALSLLCPELFHRSLHLYSFPGI